ncbi:MAG: hypothetical protein ACI8P3_000426, partial [Saprospiraceae bacterium]
NYRRKNGESVRIVEIKAVGEDQTGGQIENRTGEEIGDQKKDLEENRDVEEIEDHQEQQEISKRKLPVERNKRKLLVERNKRKALPKIKKAQLIRIEIEIGTETEIEIRTKGTIRVMTLKKIKRKKE